MLVQPNAASFDYSFFKQTALKHAATDHSGSAKLLGDVMHEMAELLGSSHKADLHIDASAGHGKSGDHGPHVTDDFGAAIKGGKGKGGSSGGSTPGGDTTSTGTTDATGGSTTTTTTTTSLDTSSPAPQYVVTDLLSPYSWGHGAVTIKYSFLDSLPTYYSSTATESHSFSVFNSSQEAAARSVLAQISSFTNATFVETTNDAYSQIAFGNAALGSGIGAWTYYPYSTGTYNQAGDVWINSQYSYNFSPNPGNYAYLTLLHEVGHAMGLKHPTEGTAVLPTAEDSRLYTDMSYRADALMPGVEPQTYMLYDIAALQSLYGVNTTTGAGDNVYSFAGANNLLETIWDASGIDTFDATGLASAVTLDLQGGHFSSIGTLGATSLAQNNVTIAYNVTIENGYGGSGNDTIFGNYAANKLAGGAGNDVLTGGGSADYFVFTRGGGQDKVTDFQHGTDFIDLRSIGVTMTDVYVSDSSTGAVVQVADVSVTLTGVAASQIDSHDFLFT